MKKKTGLIIVGSIVLGCCFIVGIVSIFVVGNISNLNNQCALAKVNTCVPLELSGETLVNFSVENTCNHSLDYVKVTYAGYSISGDLLASNVQYIENLPSGESKYFALTLNNPGGNIRNCSAIVVCCQNIWDKNSNLLRDTFEIIHSLAPAN